ncbi:rhamnan synthesis F family protein [Muricoccus vinaceus]|uniref:Rhamnan synthesis F family protein n=1 Tax=Muricoccus vinaceus TaxID=424704 RepID=A0ABV6ISY8_9PROT
MDDGTSRGVPSAAVLPEPDGAAPEPTELVLLPWGSRRLVHALAYQAPLRFAGRVLEVGTEVAMARVADMLAARRLVRSQVLGNEPGLAPPASGGRRVALYLHYAASGRISPMVRAQLAAYRAQGFDVVLASNAERVDEAGWRAASEHCWQMLRRRNLGFDFGAWRDSAALLLLGACPPEELLLVNDSVMGPIRPLGTLLERARAFGLGAVGMTESRQGGVHIQSYFLLVRGAAATADTLQFLSQLRLSTAKWLIVQRGEFGLTRFLLQRGHRVAALFGYARSLEAVLADWEERRYLAELMPQFARGAASACTMQQMMLRWPLNPTIHLWRGLPRCMSFPFLKVELLRRNPGRLPGVADWPLLTGGDSSEMTEMLREHLSALD